VDGLKTTRYAITAVQLLKRAPKNGASRPLHDKHFAPQGWRPLGPVTYSCSNEIKVVPALFQCSRNTGMDALLRIDWVQPPKISCRSGPVL
jgi:hypothetical protein